MGKATSEPPGDPFLEQAPRLKRGPLQLLGGRFQFESNSEALLRIVDEAYAGLPAHRLSTAVPRMTVGLHLTSREPRDQREPAPLRLLASGEFLGAATPRSNFVAINVADRSALVTVAAQMLRFPYHLRYELLEFAVFTLATRVQGLVPLHAACVGKGGRALLLMGDSGAGKSTISLQALLQGLEFVSEDSTFVAPGSMLCTGVANFLHVRSDAVRWVDGAAAAATIRKSPVISRRSGVRKFEVDLRRGRFPLAASALELAAVVFLSAQAADHRALLQPLSRAEILRRLVRLQPFAANQAGWSVFCRKVARRGAFELRRGHHPLEAARTLHDLLEAG
jgi:hypothetical protein